MTCSFHAPSRRELLLGSGALFAWAYLPKAALAEGRDPRLLVIVLRGALDGLATVAPVGDPDWVRLRGDKALLLDGASPALPLNSCLALNPAMPTLHRCIGLTRLRSCTRLRRPSASARISMARMCWKADWQNLARPTAAG